VSALSIKNNSIVVAGSGGTLLQYPIIGSSIQPEDADLVEAQKVDGGVVAISMDEHNNEGLVGTEAGSIHYINFAERVVIRLVSSNNCYQGPANLNKFDPVN
jgi:hypothetical protein